MQIDNNITIRAVIPHYFFEKAASNSSVGSGFGSSYPGSRLVRSMALSRCLQGLLNLRRSSKDLQLNLRTANAELTPVSAAAQTDGTVEIEIVVLVHAQNYLLDVLTLFGRQVQVLRQNLDDPRELGLAARDWLIAHPAPADLNLYLEDDLVIHDPLFAHKMLWMAHHSNQGCVLLPHRFEQTRHFGIAPRLLIDGPINHEEIADWHRAEISVATGQFRNEKKIRFDCPSNPHSGCFGITRYQLNQLASMQLPRCGFVGPLETAATLTVGCAFRILKPALVSRDFFMIEHGHPSYLGYIDSEQYSPVPT